MGNSSQAFAPIELTPELLKNSVDAIFSDKFQEFGQQTIDRSLRAIMQQFEQKLIFNMTQDKKTSVNKTALQIFFQSKQNFQTQLFKLINFLCCRLQAIMKSTSFLLVKRQDWKICLDIANFLIIFTDQKTITVFQTLSVRSDLTQESQRLVKELQTKYGQFQSREFISDRMPTLDVQRIEKCFRITLTSLIKLKNQVLSRSQKTMNIIEPLEQSCFMLYLKLYFSPGHHGALCKKARSQHIKSNLTIGAYFLAYGVANASSSIYQSAVIFLDSLLQKNKEVPVKIIALPSPLFKTLPIVSNNCIYEYILVYILYGLTFIREKQKLFIKFVCNRIMSLKLAQTILDERKLCSQQISFYLEQLCIQVKAAQIERAFLTQLATAYVKIQLEAGVSKVSPVLQKFKQSAKFTYNLNFANKRYKVTTEELVTELQNDENTYQKEFRSYCQKYMYYAVLNKTVITFFDDRYIWGEVLSGLGDTKAFEDKPSIDWKKNSKKEALQQKSMEREKQSQDSDERRVDLQEEEIQDQRYEQKEQQRKEQQQKAQQGKQENKQKSKQKSKQENKQLNQADEQN